MSEHKNKRQITEDFQENDKLSEDDLEEVSGGTDFWDPDPTDDEDPEDPYPDL